MRGKLAKRIRRLGKNGNGLILGSPGGEVQRIDPRLFRKAYDEIGEQLSYTCTSEVPTVDEYTRALHTFALRERLTGVETTSVAIRLNTLTTLLHKFEREEIAPVIFRYDDSGTVVGLAWGVVELFATCPIHPDIEVFKADFLAIMPGMIAEWYCLECGAYLWDSWTLHEANCSLAPVTGTECPPDKVEQLRSERLNPALIQKIMHRYARTSGE